MGKQVWQIRAFGAPDWKSLSLFKSIPGITEEIIDILNWDRHANHIRAKNWSRQLATFV